MRVLVIGGGIGGRAAALALRQRGVPAGLYTATPAPAPGEPPEEPPAEGLWLPPNAMSILEKMGQAEAVREAGVLLERALVERPDGTVLYDIGLSSGAQGGPSVALSRAALRALLTAKLPAATRHGGMTCTGFSKGRGRITARFENGTEVSGEVLLGADGARSGVRQRLFPSATLRGAEQVRYAGVARSRGAPRAAPVVREIWGDGLRFGFLPFGDGGKKVYWFATQRAEEVPVSARPPRAMATSLARRYAAFPAPVPALIAATPPAGIARGELRDLAPLPAWHRGRVALLGDAAHAATPNLGQGAAQALQDAHAFALALDGHDAPAAAFSAYEALRVDRAQRAQRHARRVGQMAHAGRVWARLRDGALRLVPRPLWERPLRQLFAGSD